MGANFEDFRSNPEVAAIIKMKAKSFSRHKLFQRSDRPVIEEDLQSNLFEQCHKFDPVRGTMQAYTCMRCNSWFKEQVRFRGRQKRCHDYNAQSLDRTVTEADEESTTLAAMLDQVDALRRRQGQPSLTGIDLFEMREAIKFALGQLSPKQQRLVALFMQFGAAETASELGVWDSTIRRQLHEMRGVFEKAGFGSQ
jgi:DNA-directed RNA polymerase specialized sigma24 family protein